MMQLSLTASLLALVGVAFATQGEWQQCGGIGWTGGTQCGSGLVCTQLNPYYFQCLKGTATSAPPTSHPVSSSTVSSASPTWSPPTTLPPYPTNFWFSFGDSYTQTQFDVNGTQPSIGNPLGNPPYPGYTAVGGENWIDVMTVKYNKSRILTYNYAYGGATIDASLVAPYETTVLSLTDQVNQFLNSPVSSHSVPWSSANSIFSFWIGINDIGNSYYQSGSRDAFADTLLDAYFALVQKLVICLYVLIFRISTVGARNFLFINVPPIDRSPLMLSQAASAQAAEKTVITGFNTKLAQRVASFKAANSGVTTWVWDSNAAFTTVLNSPQTYGFIDNTSYGNTGDFWGNNYHPSSAAQDIWGKDVSQLLSNTIW